MTPELQTKARKLAWDLHLLAQECLADGLDDPTPELVRLAAVSSMADQAICEIVKP